MPSSWAHGARKWQHYHANELQKQAWLAVLPALGLLVVSAGAQTKPTAKFHLQEASIADIQRVILAKQITSRVSSSCTPPLRDA
jgi:selenocysteine lyase/cysteine desulfurase